MDWHAYLFEMTGRPAFTRGIQNIFVIAEVHPIKVIRDLTTSKQAIGTMYPEIGAIGEQKKEPLACNTAAYSMFVVIHNS